MGSINKEHFAIAFCWSFVIKYPQIGGDVSTVEKILRQGYDSIEQVTVEQHLTNIALSCPCITIEEWRPIENNAYARASVTIHLSNHVLQEE